MSRSGTTTIKVNLEEIEMLSYALYVFDTSALNDRQVENIGRLKDRLSRAEERV